MIGEQGAPGWGHERASRSSIGGIQASPSGPGCQPSGMPNVASMRSTEAVRSASVARSQDGFRTSVNTGRIGGQEVYHLHIHVIGGPKPLGPMIVRQ